MAAPDDLPLDWRQAIDETAELGLRRFSVFLTGLDAAARQECYALLRKRRMTHDFVLPFVHARSDMQPDEYRMFMAEFGTERFNLHPVEKNPLPPGGLPEDLRQIIYIENVGRLKEEQLADFAGICLDISHLEITRRNFPDYFPTLCALVEKYHVGANHVSAYATEEIQGKRDDKHRYSSLDEFDYLKRYPLDYFGKYVAIELTNPLPQQLLVKRLLDKWLGLV